jgi:hypothetical protein
VAFSPDGKLLAAGSADGTVGLWEAATLRPVFRSAPSPTAVESVAFSPDGKLLASGNTGREVRLWAVPGGRLVREVRSPGDRVAYQGSALGFSADGRTLAVGGWEAIALWEVATGKERLRLKGHRGDVRSVAFTPDGRSLVSGAGDHTALIWDLARAAGAGPGRALTARELESAWRDLAGAEAAPAYRAVGALAADPARAPPLLRRSLKSAAPDTRRIARLIWDLDHDEFAVREKASEELARLGDAAEPALREATQRGASAEARARAARLLDQLPAAVVSGEALRQLRALEVLERFGTAEAREVLADLARDAAGTPLGEGAKAALQRLSRRPAPSP